MVVLRQVAGLGRGVHQGGDPWSTGLAETLAGALLSESGGGAAAWKYAEAAACPRRSSSRCFPPGTYDCGSGCGCGGTVVSALSG
jgi:hypothetical protein